MDTLEYSVPNVTEAERKVGMSTKDIDEPLTRVSLGWTDIEVEFGEEHLLGHECS